MVLEDKLVALLNTDNDRLNYQFVSPAHRTLKIYKVHDDTMLDYPVTRTAEAIKKGHGEDLPLSFFQINEGDIQAGKAWYKRRFPKLHDDLAELMARYNWGDLKYATKKSLRNQRKKSIKKTGSAPKLSFNRSILPTIIQLG